MNIYRPLKIGLLGLWGFLSCMNNIHAQDTTGTHSDSVFILMRHTAQDQDIRFGGQDSVTFEELEKTTVVVDDDTINSRFRDDSLYIMTLHREIASANEIATNQIPKIHRRAPGSTDSTLSYNSEPKVPLVIEENDSLRKEQIAGMELTRVLSEKRKDSLLQVAHEVLSVDQYTGIFRSQLFYTCAVSVSHSDLRIYNRINGDRRSRRPLTHTFETIHSLAEEEGKRLIFAMNAGMYERDRTAKGLLISDGELQRKPDRDTVGYGNFYMQPNGVFAITRNGEIVLTTTQHFLERFSNPNKLHWATQSGPMMIVDGQINDKFNDGSSNRHIRNAVGVTPYGEVIFAMSRRPVTFFEMASFLLHEGCINALYLDGAISAIYSPEFGRSNLRVGDHLGPIIVVFE